MSQKAPFPTVFSQALRAAAEAHTGSKWESRLTPASLDTAAMRDTPLAVALRFRGEFDGELFLCPDEQASQHTFAAAGDPAVAQNFPSAWLDLCESTADRIAQTLSAELGVVALEDCRLLPLPSHVTSLADIQLHAGDLRQGTIALLGDTRLRASLEKVGIQAVLSADTSLQTTSNPGQPPLQRVIDVPLAVTLRFGQRQLTLRELLELNTGSLVELDRQVEEPVELMLGERVIARGEVVIVDGNYGMRVSEVVEHPAHRLTGVA